MSEFIKPNPKIQIIKQIDLSKLGPGEYGDTESTVKAGQQYGPTQEEKSDTYGPEQSDGSYNKWNPE